MHIRNMQKREEYYNLARQIKYIEGKLRKSVTTFVTQHQTDGRTLEITDKTPLGEVIIKENVKIFTRPKELVHYLMTPICTYILGLQVKAHRQKTLFTALMSVKMI